MLTRDPKIPVTFDLPDGDSVALITWEFVVDKCNTILGGLVDNLELINTDLGRIDTKLSEWIDEEEEDENNG